MGKKYDGSLVFDTHIDTKEFENGIGKLKSIAKTGAVAIGTAFTTGLGALIVSGAKFNATIESYTTSFEVMTGSAEKAAETVERLRKMGAETPFELTGLADTTQLLMNYGFEADTAIERMTMLGDISQGNQEKLTRIATAYGQMSSAGKVLLEDVKQMIEAGFNPLQEISQTTGESMASLYERISKGNIAVEEITNSMKRSTSEGGRYFQSMEKQSKTASGQLSTLKDNWNTFLGALAESSSESLKGSILPQLNEALETATNLVDDGALDGINILVEKVAGFAADAIPAIIKGVSEIRNTLVAGLSEISKYFEIIKAAAVGIVAAVMAIKISTLISAAMPAIISIVTALSGMNTVLLQLSASIILVRAKMLALNAIPAVVVGATAAFITWQRTMDSTSNVLRNVTKEHERAISAIDKKCNAEIAEAAQVGALIDKIVALGNEYNSCAKGTEEAEQKSAEFNSIANQLSDIIPDIQNALYNETGEIYVQVDAVEKLKNKYIELAKAKAIAEALKDKMKETAGRIIELQGRYDKLNPKTGEAIIKGDNRSWAEKLLGRWRANNVLTASREVKKELSSLEDEMNGYTRRYADVAATVDQISAEMLKNTKSTGNGLGNVAGSTGNALKNTAQKTAKDLDKIASEEERKAEKARERELQELKDQLELSEITEAEYYERLADYRDKYFEEGSDEWYNYSIEIAKYQKRIADSAVEEQKKMVEKIIELRDELADKLRTDNDSLLETTQTTIHGSIFGEDGSGSYTSYSLADLEKENSRLEHYRDVILKLKDLGNVPAGIFTKLRDMSVEDGTRLAETILNADEEARSKFMNDYRSRDDLSDDIATQLSPILDAEKFEEEGIVAAQSFTDGYSKKLEEDKTAFIKILENRFGTLPDFYYNLGTDSANEFDKGFFEKVPEIVERFKQLFISEINSIAATISSGTAGKIRVSAAGGGNTYNTNTFTFNAAKQTVTEQLNEAKRAATLAKMRGN